MQSSYNKSPKASRIADPCACLGLKHSAEDKDNLLVCK